jgi:hypothetical protein
MVATVVRVPVSVTMLAVELLETLVSIPRDAENVSTNEMSPEYTRDNPRRVILPVPRPIREPVDLQKLEPARGERPG